MDNGQGIKGQNVYNPKKHIKRHVLIVYNKKIYDPSYGTFFDSGVTMTDALVLWENTYIWGLSQDYQSGKSLLQKKYNNLRMIKMSQLSTQELL